MNTDGAKSSGLGENIYSTIESLRQQTKQPIDVVNRAGTMSGRNVRQTNSKGLSGEVPHDVKKDELRPELESSVVRGHIHPGASPHHPVTEKKIANLCNERLLLKEKARRTIEVRTEARLNPQQALVQRDVIAMSPPRPAPLLEPIDRNAGTRKMLNVEAAKVKALEDARAQEKGMFRVKADANPHNKDLQEVNTQLVNLKMSKKKGEGDALRLTSEGQWETVSQKDHKKGQERAVEEFLSTLEGSYNSGNMVYNKQTKEHFARQFPDYESDQGLKSQYDSLQENEPTDILSLHTAMLEQDSMREVIQNSSDLRTRNFDLHLKLSTDDRQKNYQTQIDFLSRHQADLNSMASAVEQGGKPLIVADREPKQFIDESLSNLRDYNSKLDSIKQNPKKAISNQMNILNSEIKNLKSEIKALEKGENPKLLEDAKKKLETYTKLRDELKTHFQEMNIPALVSDVMVLETKRLKDYNLKRMDILQTTISTYLASPEVTNKFPKELISQYSAALDKLFLNAEKGFEWDKLSNLLNEMKNAGIIR